MLIFNKFKKSRLIHKLFWISISLGLLLSIIWAIERFANINRVAKCEPKLITDLSSNETRTLQGEIKSQQVVCYEVFIKEKQKLMIDSDVELTLRLPDGNVSDVQGVKDLPQPGEYLLTVENIKNYQIKLDIEKENKTSTQNSDRNPTAKTQVKRRSVNNQDKKEAQKLTYNSTKPPVYKQNKELQKIVDNILSAAQQKGLNIDKLSISLIDLNSTDLDGYAYASFQGDRPRYPASIVKLFWLVVLFGQYERGILPSGKISEQTLSDLIVDSDNEAGSFVLDTITKSESGSSLSSETIKAWKAKRDTANSFFENAGYTKINISQKTYPIPYLKMNLPVGRDKQIRDKNLKLRSQESNPIRNYLTTESVARLLLEIYTDQSISDSYSNEIKKLLKRDLNPAAWKHKPYNAIAGFLGEGLPSDTNFYSKMGWTFGNRNDAAIIISPDRKTSYVLVIFGDDKSFYQDKSFLPQVSKEVYQKMSDM